MKLLTVTFALSTILQQVALAQKLFTGLEELTDGNWIQKVQPADDTLWLVAFYVPWCPHAQKFAPKLESISADLSNRHYKINYGAVDVSTNPQLGHHFSIDSSPLIKMLSFKNG